MSARNSPNLRRTKFEVRNFTLPEIDLIGGRPTRKIWAVSGYAHAPFCPKFLLGFRSDGLCEMWMYRSRLKSVALPVSEIIAIGALVGGCKPQSWRRGGCRVSWMVPFERALRSSYRPSIVTFPLSVRVSEILPLLCSSTPLFHTPPLVSPNFPMFPWE